MANMAKRLSQLVHLPILRSIDTFEVRFTREPPVFATGEQVSGSIFISSQAKFMARELFIHIKGEGNNTWMNQQTEQVLGYRQMYIDSVLDLPPPSVEKAGMLEIPFDFQLANELPSAVEGEFGFIRYSVKAAMELHPTADDCGVFGGHGPETASHTANFDVVKSFDLRTDMNHARPVEIEDYAEFFTCCCLRTGYIQVKVRLAKLGFAINEPIAISAEVENRSRKNIENVTARILQHLQFYGQSEFLQTDEIKVSKILVGGKEWGGVPRRTRQIFPHEILPIVVQKLVPSQFQAAINVEYTVLFEIEPTGPTLEIPLVLGTVPCTVPCHQEQAEPGRRSGDVYSRSHVQGRNEANDDRHQQEAERVVPVL